MGTKGRIQWWEGPPVSNIAFFCLVGSSATLEARQSLPNAGTLTLDFLASRTSRNDFFCCLSVIHSVLFCDSNKMSLKHNARCQYTKYTQVSFPFPELSLTSAIFFSCVPSALMWPSWVFSIADLSVWISAAVPSLWNCSPLSSNDSLLFQR